ncbi:MAG: hypothetical protein E7774_08680 [Bradyrhizobium sp.]|nr:MAG: hypothetical protein E7774_08680 [Bradyrhizobium sp.]
MLGEIDNVVSRVKQSRIYRRAGDIFIMWGLLQFVRRTFFYLLPHVAAVSWFAVDLVGIALTVLMLRGHFRERTQVPVRLLATFALFYGFGWIWTGLIGDFGSRQLATFWPTLFQFGYALAGLWFGFAFLVIGLGATALTLAAYLWIDHQFWLALSIVNGGSLILAGLWMRRA